MLLRGAGDGGDAAEVGARPQPPEEQVQRFRPHKRRRHDAAPLAGVSEDAAAGAVVRQVRVEVDGVGGHDAQAGVQHRGLERPVWLVGGQRIVKSRAAAGNGGGPVKS